MTGKNGLWDGTPLAERPVDAGLVRLLRADATQLERAAAQLREAVSAGLAETDEGRHALALADATDARASRLWQRIDKMLDGGGR